MLEEGERLGKQFVGAGTVAGRAPAELNCFLDQRCGLQMARVGFQSLFTQLAVERRRAVGESGRIGPLEHVDIFDLRDCEQ